MCHTSSLLTAVLCARQLFQQKITPQHRVTQPTTACTMARGNPHPKQLLLDRPCHLCWGRQDGFAVARSGDADFTSAFEVPEHGWCIPSPAPRSSLGQRQGSTTERPHSAARRAVLPPTPAQPEGPAAASRPKNPAYSQLTESSRHLPTPLPAVPHSPGAPCPFSAPARQWAPRSIAATRGRPRTRTECMSGRRRSQSSQRVCLGAGPQGRVGAPRRSPSGGAGSGVERRADGPMSLETVT